MGKENCSAELTAVKLHLFKRSKLYQEKMENEKTEIQASVVKLKDELTSTKTKNTKLEEENMNLKSRLAKETSTLRQTVNVLPAD